MLLNHASIRDSKWQQDKALADTVFETMKKDESKLPTPLNIELLCCMIIHFQIHLASIFQDMI